MPDNQHQLWHTGLLCAHLLHDLDGIVQNACTKQLVHIKAIKVQADDFRVHVKS